MRQTLQKRILIFAFIILSLAILASTVMDIVVFRRDYVKELVLRSQGIGNSLKTSIEKVLVLGLSIQDVVGLTDKCREVIQADADLAFCVVTDVNGTPLVLSDPRFAALPFVSRSERLATDGPAKLYSHTLVSPAGNFITTATPLLSYDSKPVGYVHVGFPQRAVDDKLKAIVVRSLVVFCAAFLVAFGLVAVFAKRSIIAPIAHLLDGISRIARGEYGYTVRALPMMELDELGSKINYLAITLKNRDEELRKNYEELSETYKQLHNSHARLERLSGDLEKSEKLYKKLLEVSGDAIIILDSCEHVVIANRQAEDLLTESQGQIVGQHVSSLLLKLQVGDVPHVLKIISSAYDASRTSEDVTGVSRDGGKMFFRMYANSVSMAEANFLQLIFRDMTAEKETLSNLEKSAAGLARLNKMKDSFLGLASHELKTPLTVIMGYSELLMSDTDEQMSDSAREMVANISNAAARLDNIIKDMIDVSMIDQKQLGLKRQPLQINALIESTVRELRFFFALRKQEIATTLSADLPVYHGDQTRLMQLFSNVIGNAIKFTPDGGRISVATSLKRIARDMSGYGGGGTFEAGRGYCEAIEIVVEDTGIGINPDEQTRIFEKFYEAGNIQEHSSGKVAFKSRGVGLGLAIAKGVAEMHGGQIWVESSGYDPVSNPGSKFFILLPLDPQRPGDSIEV